MQAAGVHKLSVPPVNVFADLAEAEIFVGIGVVGEREASRKTLARIEGCHDLHLKRMSGNRWIRDVKSLFPFSRTKLSLTRSQAGEPTTKELSPNPECYSWVIETHPGTEYDKKGWTDTGI